LLSRCFQTTSAIRKLTLTLILMSLLLILFASTGCIGSRPGDWKFGESLAIRVAQSVILDEVSYTDGDGKSYAIRPHDDGNKLHVYRLVANNTQANLLSFQINDRTIQLIGAGNVQWEAVDPFGDKREEADSTSSTLNKYSPFLWGNFELRQGYQIEGWLIFELPNDNPPTALRWDTGDTIILGL
jgi:hypothetical protein